MCTLRPLVVFEKVPKTGGKIEGKNSANFLHFLFKLLIKSCFCEHLSITTSGGVGAAGGGFKNKKSEQLLLLPNWFKDQRSPPAY